MATDYQLTMTKTTIYAYGEKVDGIWVWTFPILSLYGLSKGLITSGRGFVCRRLKSAYLGHTSEARRQGIALPKGIDKNIKIKKVII